MQTLLAAKKAYDQDQGNDPIRLSDYIAFLDAFESIIVMLRVPGKHPGKPS